MNILLERRSTLRYALFRGTKRKNDEKAKRDTRIVLSADGEMIEAPIEPDTAEKTKPNYQ